VARDLVDPLVDRRRVGHRAHRSAG
jgi:hypothetical protein